MDKPTTRPVRVELDLEVDTGAVRSPRELHPSLMQTNVSLQTYTSEKIPVKGKLYTSPGTILTEEGITYLLCCSRRWPLSHGPRLAQTLTSQLERDKSRYVGYNTITFDVAVAKVWLRIQG